MAIIPHLEQRHLDAAKVIGALCPPEAIGESVRILRERTGLTQRKLAEALHRNRATVANWEAGTAQPPRAIVPAVLSALQVPPSVIRSVITTVDPDRDLSPASYLTADPVQIEYDWWLRNRGKVLTALRDRSLAGSDAATKLLLDQGRAIMQAVAAQRSAPREVGPRPAWQRRAISAAAVESDDQADQVSTNAADPATEVSDPAESEPPSDPAPDNPDPPYLGQ
jgi:transcriptional regulator with XRE-family HTH domain